MLSGQQIKCVYSPGVADVQSISVWMHVCVYVCEKVCEKYTGIRAGNLTCNTNIKDLYTSSNAPWSVSYSIEEFCPNSVVV